MNGSIETGPDSRLVRFLVAIGAAMVAFGANLLLDDFLVLIPGVVFSAWYGGLKPGLITTLILSFAAPADPIRLTLFLVASTAICAAMQKVRTGRVKSQQAETRLNAVLESTRDAIVTLDPDLCITYANRRAAKLARKTSGEMRGKSFRTVFPELPKMLLYKELTRALREKVHVRVEDGLEQSHQWFRFNAYPVPAGLNVFVTDITAEKKMQIEKARHPQEQVRFEEALRQLPVGVIIVSANLRVEMANPAAMGILGVTIAPGDYLPDVCTSPLDEAARTGQAISNREMLWDSRTLVVNCIPIAGGVIGTYSDVTSLRRAENRLRTLFGTPAIGVIAGDGPLIQEANDAFLKMLGLDRAVLEAGEITWPSITPKGFEEADERALRQLAERGFSDPFEKEYFRSDGERISVLLGSASCEPGSSWIAWVIDLSEKRRLENRLREAAKLESIGLLAGGIAHDFNNILTGVLGHSSIALESLEQGHSARAQLESAIACAERAADLTRQLLAYAGKGRFVVGPVDISRLAREIGRLIWSSVPRDVELEFDLPGGLPQVEADAIQLQQLVMNLVINGAEAVGESGGSVRVATSSVDIDEAWIRSAGLDLTPGTYVSLEVHDTGCGMDEETVRNIFDPFFTTKFTGRGLGLAAATGIARSHRGAIKVYSAPGVGSTFRVLLPAMPARLTAPEPDKVTVAVPHGVGTVLVVDDEEMVRRVAKLALEKYGYTVLVAANGSQALEIYRGLSHSISMVLLDMTMPVMGGQEALRNLRAIHPEVKVLLTSGFSSAPGEGSFIQKPYTAEALATRVHEVLQSA